MLSRLHPGLRLWIKEQNWRDLTPIQKAVMDPVFSNKDCVIEAPTAGGKTEAVLFPTLTKAAADNSASVQILYLAPLKALLNNLEERAKIYTEQCGLQAFKWHGDVSHTDKLQQWKTPPNLLLTTPESLEAMLLRRAGWQEMFHHLQTVIIDEAHSFAAGDRGAHLLALLERLGSGIKRRPQRLALTATIGNPHDMCQWLSGPDSRTVRVSVPYAENRLRTDFLVCYFPDTGDYGQQPVPGSGGMDRLRYLIREVRNRRSITFVRSRSQAEDMAKAVGELTRDRVKVSTHHSAVSRFFREEAEKLIGVTGESGLNTIFSTSTLELGIDIGALDAVIQLDGLSSPSAFLQRVGRTGRRPGTARHFRGLTTDLEALLLLSATVSLGTEARSEDLAFRRRSFHLLAHQILCFVLQNNGATPAETWEVLDRAHCFSGITTEEFMTLVQHMIAEDYLHQEDRLLLPGSAAEQQYLGANWRGLFAVFTSAPMYDVYEGRTHVGTLDSMFVSDLKTSSHFVLAGRRWQARRISHESKTVQAVKAGGGSAPKWESFGGPAVPFETAQRAGEIRHGYCPVPDFLDAHAHAALSGVVADSGTNDTWQPGTIHLAVHSGELAITTYAGDAINRTLAALLSNLGYKSRSSYADVTATLQPGPAIQLPTDISDLLDNLANPGQHDRLEGALLAQQRSWNFSPFSRMLPPALNQMAIIDQYFDLPGLFRLAADDSVHLPASPARR